MAALGLAESLSSDFESMFSLLQSWDADGDGVVSATDFRLGLQSLGFTVTADEADCLCRALDKSGDGQIRLAALELASAPDAKLKPKDETPLSTPQANGAPRGGRSPAPAPPTDAPHTDALLAAQRALAAAAASPADHASPQGLYAEPDSANGLTDEATDPFERYHERSGPAATGDTQPLHTPQQPAYQPAAAPMPSGVPSAVRSGHRPASANKKESLRSFGELAARVRDVAGSPRSPLGEEGEGGELGPHATELLSSHLARSGLAFMEGSRVSLAPSSIGRRSSLAAAESFTSKDVASLPERLAALLVTNHARVIDLFRSWDDDEDGVISRDEFAKGLKVLGLDKQTKASDIDELFAALDVNGDGLLGYEELHRMLRVGAAARMSEYVRDSAKGGATSPPAQDYVARERWRGPRAVDEKHEGAPVDEAAWPAGLRVLLVRERKRVVDLFRHWEGGEDAAVSAEHFKAGLFVLGHQVARSQVAALFRAMGAAPAEGDELRLPFRELRRQLRVAAQHGSSGYLRAAARQGAALEAATPRGVLLSEMDASAADHLRPDAHMAELSAALGYSSPGYSTGLDLATVQHLGLASGAFARSGTDLGGGVLGLGAFASSARDRSRAAAEAAAEAAAAPGRQAVHSSEMMLQQWARTHYSSLLGELRKWELRPHGEVSFDAFADSLVSLGFPATGKWQEIESVWFSWSPTEAGTHHWLRLRAHLTGGRMIKVQEKKQTVAMYFKQASRAGEGFGNRSSPRFREPNPTLVGPGKYMPEGARASEGTGSFRWSGAPAQPHPPRAGGTASAASDGSARGSAKWSGKMNNTAERFRTSKGVNVPGPGRYKPKHTLTDARGAIS